MKIGIVGYAGSGKSTLFELLTGVPPDPAHAHLGQSAMAVVPEPRLDELQKVYDAKKITRASLELVDTPGLSRKSEENAARLAILREAGCLVLVVAGFAGSEPLDELASFEEDLKFADLELLTKRVEKLRELVKKPRPSREQDEAELESLEPLQAALEEGQSLRDIAMTEQQLTATKAFRLLTEKPRLIVVNTADDDTELERFTNLSTETNPIVAAPLGLELELSRMNPEDRAAFEEEMGVKGLNREELIHKLLDVSHQMLFFTAGEREVRTWLIDQGATALDAAASIHTDLARGFIRAEVMKIDDLLRLGSEREVKAQNLAHKEHKDYVIQEGDVLLIHFNV